MADYTEEQRVDERINKIMLILADVLLTLMVCFLGAFGWAVAGDCMDNFAWVERAGNIVACLILEALIVLNTVQAFKH